MLAASEARGPDLLISTLDTLTLCYQAITLSRMSEVRLRAPTWSRVYTVVFLLVWEGLLLSFAFRRPGASPVVPVLMGLAGLLLGYRILRLGVDAAGDRLVIRNNIRSRSLQRTDIESFRQGAPPNLSWGSCIFAATRGGDLVALDVTTRPFMLASSKRRQASDLAGLQEWLHTSHG